MPLAHSIPRPARVVKVYWDFVLGGFGLGLRFGLVRLFVFVSVK